MKLTTVVVSAIMALGVAAVPYAEAGNDVDVEARDFSGESLTEFDARSPEEEEFETRDEEDDLVARGDYNKCGWGAYEKHGKCYCKDHKLVYNEHKKKCEKPFSCRGKNVEIVDNYGKKECKCLREGEEYDSWKGCKCKHGEEYSEKYKKCIPDCPYGEEYDGHECKKPFTCKGKNVKIEDDGYGNKKCVCKLENQSYDEHKGCQCDKGYSFSWKEHKCIKDCPYGETYSWEHKKCYKPCKGKNVREVWEYDNLVCKCEKRGQEYDEHKGCYYKCPEGSEYNEHKRECECKDSQKELKYGHCVDRCPGKNDYWNGHKCVCKRGYELRHGKCEKPEVCPYGSYFDKHAWKCVCKDDDKKFEHGRCVERCPNEHDSWNEHKHKCECDKGYISRHGKCVKKPETCKGYGSYFDEHEWKCKCRKESEKYTPYGCKDRCPNEHDSWNSYSKSCVCDKGYESRHGKCVKKPSCKGEGSYWDEHAWKCKCKKGYESTKWGCKKSSYGGY